MTALYILQHYFLLFMIYAVAGWCIEEVHCSIAERKVVDRGFLIGPICPIYGFGGVAITLFLTKFNESPITVFCMAIFLCAILEYFTSYIMEKIFNARWWDYSNDKLNLNGRICIRTLIPFGVFGLLIIYFFNPLIYKTMYEIEYSAILLLTIAFAVIFILDIIISFIVISGVTSRAKNISKANPRDNTEEITEKVKDELRESFVGNRLVDAYPDFVAFKSRIKEIAHETVKKGKETAQKGKKAVKNGANKGKEAVKNTANKGRKAVKNTAIKGKKAIRNEKYKVLTRVKKSKETIKNVTKKRKTTKQMENSNKNKTIVNLEK